MAGTTLWDKLSDELAKADIDQFQEKAISLLRVLNPSFVKCSDIPGADLIVKSDNDRLLWVVQCQTFDVSSTLSISQADEIYLIVKAFLDQGYKCDKYWVLHNHQHGNRTGKFNEFVERIESFKDLSEISENINEFLVLQRQEFLQRVEKEFRNVLIDLFQRYSEKCRLEVEDKLEFGKYYIPGVSTEEYEILFKESNPLPDLKRIETETFKEASQLVVSDRKDVRWTLMHGEAGAGKTTTALHAAMARNKVVLFINCDVLDFYSLRSGTNFLFESILRSLKILDEEFEDEKDRELLYSLSGASLHKTIEHSENHILLFDGLDENRFYSDPQNQGLKRLSDRLSDIHCPIVLVTRTLHFKESLFNELVTLSGKRGSSKARRKARALRLTKWTEEQVIQLINKILNDQENYLDEESQVRISKFKDLLLNHSYKDFYGDLPLNPLFLQFILSDIVERDIQKANRCILIYQWVRQKIYRDFQKEQRSFITDKIIPTSSQLDLIDKILYIMELTSRDMTIKVDDSRIDLQDFTKSESIAKIAAEVFQVDKVEIIDLLLNSVLTSHAMLSRHKFRATKNRITFSFRILQEYFLACYLIRNNEDFSQYPKTIRSLCEEIVETDLEDELWMYLRKAFKTLKVTQSPESNTSAENDRTVQQGVTIVSDKPINFYIHQEGATIGVGVATEGSRISFVQHAKQSINLPEQDLADAAQKIQNLLSQLSQTYSITNDSEQQTFVQKFVEWIGSTPNLIKVIFAGGVEGLKILCPPAGIPVEMARSLYEGLQKHYTQP